MQRKPKIKQNTKKKTEWVLFSQFSLSVLNSIRLCLLSICITRAYKIMFLIYFVWWKGETFSYNKRRAEDNFRNSFIIYE